MFYYHDVSFVNTYVLKLIKTTNVSRSMYIHLDPYVNFRFFFFFFMSLCAIISVSFSTLVYAKLRYGAHDFNFKLILVEDQY